MRETFTQLTYLAASILFILGLRSLTKPDSARRGMQYAAIGMLLAIIGTLVQHEIVRYDWIAGGLILGTIIGIPMGTQVPMTAMPQRIAISHMFGALAATLVGVAEYWLHGADARHHANGGRRLRGALRRADGDRQLHGVRQAAGDRHRAVGDVQRAERGEHHAVRRHARDVRVSDLRAG